MAKRNIKKLADELNAIFKENEKSIRVKEGYDGGSWFILTVDEYNIENMQYAQFVVAMFLAAKNIKIKNYGRCGNHWVYEI